MNDKHETNCKTCNAELVCISAIPTDDEKWQCPNCEGVDANNIAIKDDCPHCGYPCHRLHYDVMRCDQCGELNFTHAGHVSKPNPENGEVWFFCDDCFRRD